MKEVERERKTSPRKLIDVAARDFSAATGILVSFPDAWEHIETLKSPNHLLYVAGFPIERAFHGREHFEGLGPEINVNLVFYRLYKFFQPWPMPQVTIEWNESQRHGTVTDFQGFQLQLQPIGQAQAWFGLTHAVLWECYFDESRRFANWQETLARVWQAVEQDVASEKLFTAPHEPAFPTGYRDFLTGRRYAVDREYPIWWSKQRSDSHAGERKERTPIRENGLR